MCTRFVQLLKIFFLPSKKRNYILEETDVFQHFLVKAVYHTVVPKFYLSGPVGCSF